MATCGDFQEWNKFQLNKPKTGFSDLARRAEAGETIVVTRHGKPVADIVPHKRKSGLDEQGGRRVLDSLGITDPFPYVADDFDDPLPEDFLLRPLP